MRHVLAAIAAAAIICGGASEAQAGEHKDALSRCLVRATTDSDRADLMKYVFASVSKHPSLETWSGVTREQRDAATARAARIFTRLMTQDCRSESVAVLRFEGHDAFGEAFKQFGGLAGQGLMDHPAVESELGRIAEFLNEKDFEALGRDLTAAK